MEDVRSKMCETCGKIRATFGKPGGTATFCGDCKPEGMKDVVNKMCEKCGDTQPCFGKPGGTATCCVGCKEEGMENVNTKMCEGTCGEACPDKKRATRRMRYDRAKRASEGG